MLVLLALLLTAGAGSAPILDWRAAAAASCPSAEFSEQDAWTAERGGGDLRLRQLDRAYQRLRGCAQLGFRIELPTNCSLFDGGCAIDPFVEVRFTRNAQEVPWTQLTSAERAELLTAMDAHTPVPGSLAVRLWAYAQKRRIGEGAVLALDRLPHDEPRMFFAEQQRLFLGARVVRGPRDPATARVQFWPAEAARIEAGFKENPFYGRALAADPIPYVPSASAACNSGQCLLVPGYLLNAVAVPHLNAIASDSALVDFEHARVLPLPPGRAFPGDVARTVVGEDGKLTVFDFASMLSQAGAAAPVEFDFTHGVDWAVAHADLHSLVDLFNAHPDLDTVLAALRRNDAWKDAPLHDALALDAATDPREPLAGGLVIGTWRGVSVLGQGAEGAWPASLEDVRELVVSTSVLVGPRDELERLEATRERMVEVKLSLGGDPETEEDNSFATVLASLLSHRKLTENERRAVCAAEADVTRPAGRPVMLRLLENRCEAWLRSAPRSPHRACADWKVMCAQ
jgi:hypothetical protein